MQLLMLTPTLPYPLHQGAAIRNFGLIHGLHAAGHDVTLLSFHNGNPTVNSTPLAGLCSRIEIVPFPQRTSARRLYDLLFTRRPDLAQRLQSTAFTQRLCTLLDEHTFDVVQFEGLEMARYLPIVRQYQPETRLCYDAHNAEYTLQQVIYEVDKNTPRRWPVALYSRIQSQRIARFEHLICQQVDAVIAVSDEDASALRPFRPDNHVSVVSNGIFVEDYNSGFEQLDLGSNAIIFTGKMDYRPNIDAMLWFSSAIFPRIQQQIPDTHLYIVGQKPHPRLEPLRGNRCIQLTGWVADVRPFLHAGDVYVAPLRMGSGTRLKILEAMAAGCAVVATTIAAAGLPDEARQTMIIADSEQAIATAIVDLLRDPMRRRALGSAARSFVTTHYDWSSLIPRMLDIYREIGLG
jgi:glycosyltransferase involved in cell wall biosynthesis